MKSFQFPSVGKRPSASKKDLEEQKKKLEEQAAAEAFEEYVACFQESSGSKAASKVWIKAGTYEAGKKHDDSKEKGKLYKPTSRFEKDQPPGSSSSGGSGSGAGGSGGGDDDSSRRPEKPGSKKKTTEKKKSNLEIFKEELKIIQEEREERHRLKRMLGLQEVIKLPPKPGDDLRASLSLELDDIRTGSIDDGDPNTTNLYLGNLPTKITEQHLMEVFGKFGPLASVKVMWARTDEEKARNRLSGFVAFMSRRDGERALKHLNGKDILGSEIKLGWGKAVPIPVYPVYIPPQMLEMTMPPPLSGLPFNAQPDRRDKHKAPSPGTPYPTEGKLKDEFDRLLINATVKVVMPTDRSLLALIHRMVEFVIREGPMFEAMIMNKEIANPQFRFLFENQSPAHVYYRWKLYSLLQGDSTSKWRTEEFRMFIGGSVWRPPKLNPFTQGMPDELIPQEDRETRVGSLSNAQRLRLERMLRRITPDRHKVAEVMIFSIEHSESTEEICLCLREALCGRGTSLQKRIARLYVVNDVLHNCTAKGMNAFGYRKAFKSHLPRIFQELSYAYQAGGGGDDKKGSAEAFRQRVMGCFNAWNEWGLYSNDFLIRLQNIFLGLASAGDGEESFRGDEGGESRSGNEESDEEAAREKLNVHRQKLHKKSAPPRAQLPPQSAMKLVKSLQSAEVEINEEIDGVPLDDDMFPPVASYQGIGASGGGAAAQASVEKAKFKQSKWEELDPEEVKAQAVTTTSKWDLFEEGKEEVKEETMMSSNTPQGGMLVSYGDDDEDIDGEPMEEDDEEETNGGSSQIGVGGLAGGTGGGLLLGGGGTLLSAGEEERRKIMREIEVKVLAFQDELEKRGVVSGSLDLVREYREKLLRKVANPNSEVGGDRRGRRRRSSSQEKDGGSPRHSRRRHRSRSPSSSQRSSRSYNERTRSTSSNDSRSRQRSRSRSPPREDSGDEKRHSSSRRSRRRDDRKRRGSSSDSEEDRRRKR